MRLLSASRVSLMNASIASDGDARRDLAGGVAAHAVGDDEQPEVRARAVAVFVAGPAADRGPTDGRRGNAHVMAASASARASALRDDLEARERLQQRDPRALEVDVRDVGCVSRSSARRRARLGALDVDLLGALGDLREHRDAVGQHLGEPPNAIDR